ncbi:DgyrCDS434 [Dimorphilus gyrociliatus]|uniref:nitric-oxide synthase (NADPH) n=1 Tax=Dimorphilus gyrociliatus TaxID=2664684 RepID=A0A7I8V4F6_9ANNE|nr:DgyrCDS434 [Dimorphilus gyrociliatus]
MLFDCGGIEFPACPFNGWYMSTEIGCRNLCDPNRYNLTETIASHMKLDTTSQVTLWRDRAMLEVNKAVLYSFQKVNATIVDHHTASESFMKHLENEQKYRGGCPTDWVWVVPPLSSSLTSIFHQETVNYSLKPSYEYQLDAWKTFEWNKQSHNDKKKKTFKEIAKAVKFSAKLMGNALSKRIKCTILFASETGRSERFAGLLGDLFKTIFDVKFICMDDYDTSNMEHETLLFVITSTSGNGDPPENGRKFAEFLYEKKREFFAEPLSTKRSSFLRMDSEEARNQNEERVRPFSNISFSVFGLGSSAYPKFCNYAKYIHRLFRELGAEEVLELVLGDELGGQEKEFGIWAKRAFRTACRTFYSADEANISDAFTQNWSKSRSRLRKLDISEPISIKDGLSYISRKTIVRCKLMNRTQLQHKDSGRQTILIELDSTENPAEAVYQPGDHIAIYPENSPEAVSQVLEFVKCDGDFSADDVIQMERFEEEESKKWVPDERFPINFTLRIALQRYMDISSPPSQLMLKQLAGLSKDEKDQNYLIELSEDERKYEEWKYTFCQTLPLLLKQCPSVKLPPIVLLTQLPFLQPRFYSISSSPLSSPTRIDCTIAVVDYQLPNGGLRKGVCSNWLNTLPLGSSIPCYVRAEPNFRLPDNPKLPIIVVGPGTGLAPFRSFWRERLYNMKSGRMEMGEMHLYFGCRRKEYDYIYREELERCHDLGVLNSLRVAFSREPNQPKTYVQDLLERDGKSLYELLTKHNAHFYVCGDVSMAANVSTTLQIILKKVGGMSNDEASNFLLEIGDSNRFHQDIFGLTFKAGEITEKVRMNKLKSMEKL